MNHNGLSTQTPSPHPGFICRSLSLILAVLVCFALPTRADLTLVEDGQPRCVVILPAKASRTAIDGAKILTDHLHQISGAQISTIRANELPDIKISNGHVDLNHKRFDGLHPIFIGEGPLTQKLGLTSSGLGPGGILIAATSDALVLLGPDYSTPADTGGSRYAVTAFLEDQLGVRYLWPGEIGKVVPKRSTITVKPTRITHTPPFKQRSIRWNNYSSRTQEGLDRLGFSKEDFLTARQEAAETVAQSGNWMDFHRMGGTLRLRTGDGTILPAETWDRFLREHPEWFAMQLDGSRFFDPSWERPRLCKSNPQLIEAIIAEKLKEIAANRCVGTDFDSCVHHWSTQGLNYYVLAKLHWNPELDVDALIDDYCRSGFGAGHKHIRRYFDRIEQLTNRTAATKIDHPDKRKKNVTELYTPQVCAELRTLLDIAAKAETLPQVLKRIEFLRVGLEFTELQARIYSLRQIPLDRPVTDGEKARARRLLDKKWLMMRRIFTDHPYSVNVATMSWGEWWRFKSLGWEGPSETAKASASPPTTIEN